MWAALSINSSVYMSKAVVTLSPFNRFLDELSMKLPGKKYSFQIVGGKSMVKGKSTGVMEITNPGKLQLSASDWNEIINYPAYRLNLDVSDFVYTIY